MDRPAFEYKFSYDKRKAWTVLINRAFNEQTGTVVLKIDATTTMNREMKFGKNDNLEKFMDMIPTAKECTIQF